MLRFYVRLRTLAQALCRKKLFETTEYYFRWEGRMISSEHQKLFDNIKRQNSELSSRLTDKIVESSFDTGSRLPFKVKTLESILARRIYELCESAIILHNENKELAVIIITRSISETSSLLFWLSRKISKVVESRTLDDIDIFLMKNIFGTKAIEAEPEPYKPYNALTAIDKVDKVIERFRKNYDILCDYTHPNSSGGMLAFGTLNREEGVFEMKDSSEKIPIGISLNTLNMVLAICHESLTEIDNNFQTFIEICEESESEIK